MSKYLLLIFLTLLIFESSAQTEEEMPDDWVFGYAGDNFTDDALFDLRYLNENEAGENGFIQLSADGNSFVNGQGEKIRFWAVNGGSDTKDMSQQQLNKFARFLAKMGVNMIRFHGGIHPKDPSDDLTDVDKEEVDAIWRMVAAMKKEGIYSVISPFWPGKVSTMYGNWGIEGYSGDVEPWGLMFFNSKLKNAYKEWVKYLYTQNNPYTGIPLKDDPAVAIIQTMNEDGLYFWTVDGIKQPQMDSLENHYYQWLIDKYGSIDATMSAWSNESIAEEDEPEKQQMGLYIMWELTRPQTGGKAVRVNDQVEFLGDMQRSFYQEIYYHYRSLGCKQLTNGNNWKTADPTRLFDAERWTNDLFEVMAVNRYYSPNHTGENSGWRIDPGHYYQGISALIQPHKLPINIKQVEGHPFMVTESAWNLPHKYQTEGPFLISAYMSLTGVDGYFWFSPNHPNYHDFPYFGFTNLEGGQKAMHRWTVSTPGQIGMFPANALIFRKGMIQEGSSVISEKRSLEAVLNREIPLISEENSFDPNRDSYAPSEPSDTEYSPLSYLAGPVLTEYGSDESNEISSELSNLVDFQNKVITSTTGELVWDYEKGICTMNTPSAQGVTGFLNKSEQIQLSDVTISSDSEYATINVVAMDDQPIAQSSKIMIQVGTIFRPTDWDERAASFDFRGETVQGFEVTNTGKMPWEGKPMLGSITIKNNVVNRLSLLNSAGYEVDTEPVIKNGSEFTIEFPPDAMYMILQTVDLTSLDEGHADIFSVYPVPSQHKLFVQWQHKVKLTSLEITDLKGKIIYQQHKFEKYPVEVVLHDKIEGVYLLKLQDKNNKIYSQRIVLE